MAVGTLVITHLTQQDLRAKEILLPKQAVEANILPALTYSLLKFKVLRTSRHTAACCLHSITARLHLQASGLSPVVFPDATGSFFAADICCMIH